MTRYLYLHGFASGPRSAKARFFQTRLADHGLSLQVPDLAQGDFERLTITSQLHALEEAAAGQPVTLIGSSMGAYVAALYAARHAEVERLVLLAPAFGLSGRWASLLGEAQALEWRRTGWLDVYHYGEGRTRRLSFGICEDGRRYEDYPEASQPTLIVHGRADAVVPPANSVAFAQARDRVALHLLDSDHELLNVLDEIWGLSKAFLGLDSGANSPQ